MARLDLVRVQRCRDTLDALCFVGSALMRASAPSGAPNEPRGLRPWQHVLASLADGPRHPYTDCLCGLSVSA